MVNITHITYSTSICNSDPKSEPQGSVLGITVTSSSDSGCGEARVLRFAHADNGTETLLIIIRVQ